MLDYTFIFITFWRYHAGYYRLWIQKTSQVYSQRGWICTRRHEPCIKEILRSINFQVGSELSGALFVTLRAIERPAFDPTYLESNKVSDFTLCLLQKAKGLHYISTYIKLYILRLRLKVFSSLWSIFLNSMNCFLPLIQCMLSYVTVVYLFCSEKCVLLLLY